MSCTSTGDCPDRFDCYFFGSDPIGEWCACNRSYLLFGSECERTAGVSLGTQTLLVYLLGRCSIRSFFRFLEHRRKTKRLEVGGDLRRRKLIRMQILASFCIFSSSTLFFIAFLLTLAGSLAPLPSHARRTVRMDYLLYVLFPSGLLFRNLSLVITGIFWVEISPKMGIAGNGGASLSNAYRICCASLSLVTIVVGTVLGLLVSSGALAVQYFFFCLIASNCLTALVVARGRQLVLCLLRSLQTQNALPSSRRTFRNVLEASNKILFHVLLDLTLGAAFTILNAAPAERIPAMAVHLTLMAVHGNLYEQLWSLGSYHAALKVRFSLLRQRKGLWTSAVQHLLHRSAPVFPEGSSSAPANAADFNYSTSSSPSNKSHRGYHRLLRNLVGLPPTPVAPASFLDFEEDEKRSSDIRPEGKCVSITHGEQQSY